MFGRIDTRLRQAFPEKANESFGRRSTILFGDFRQLPPVLDLPMYTNNISQDTNSNKGIGTYKDIREVYELDIVQRQSGESEDQRVFRDILLRLREGESNLNDWKILAKRFEEKLTQTERDEFSDTVFLLTKWADVDRVNIEMLRRINKPVAKIEAIHTGGKKLNAPQAKWQRV